ncbi:MAG: HEAT repeat domain-containing protein [Chrysiogenetes bacterium]|nr:HEAT repeat domain-containing protein [Chrysiogenetes bacterium]
MQHVRMRRAGLVLVVGLLAIVGVACRSGGPQTHEDRVSAMESALRSGSESERRSALDSLYELGAESIPVVKPLLSSPDPELRRRAIWVLSNAGDEAFRPLAQAALYDKDENVRYDAVLALGASWDQPRQVIPVLRKALMDPDRWVRVAAIESLRAVGDPSVLAELETLTRDEDRLVRSAAISAIETLRVE